MDAKLEALVEKYKDRWHLPEFKREIDELIAKGEHFTEEEIAEVKDLVKVAWREALDHVMGYAVQILLFSPVLIVIFLLILRMAHIILWPWWVCFTPLLITIVTFGFILYVLRNMR